MSKKNVKKAKEAPKGVSERKPKRGENMMDTLRERERLAEREPMKERIRPIKGYESYYAVSTHGTIFRVKSAGELVALKPYTIKNGYQVVKLSKHNIGHTRLVHEIITSTFMGARQDGMFVRHLDGDKTNNALDNLRFGTWWENTFDMYLMGDSRFGLGALEVIAIREMAENGIPADEISEALNFSERIVRSVIDRDTYGWVPEDEESKARIIAEVTRVKGGKKGDTE